jgi:nitrate/TMAO reductase-like tetraheme cytochrome c subunit
VLARPIVVPLVRLRLPQGILLAVLGIIILVPAGGAVIVATNQPIFCNQCHEMGLHYATWSQSAHSDVTCEECHLMPGTLNMFKGKVAAFRQVRLHAGGEVEASVIQGHVPDENCRHCHAETRELVTYHGLKITHRDHWEMGVECTFCHDRVAHGPRWQFEGVTAATDLALPATPSKYAPTMETCYTCHDGEQASSKCSTCHVTLGERRSVTFDPEWVAAHREEVQHSGAQECRRCHQDAFCDRCHREANPHTRDWTERHPERARGNPEPCLTCHAAPGEPPPEDISDLAFCRACHSVRREHSGTDWASRHGGESLADPAACTQCHEESWCSDCHSLTRPHPAEWRIRHVAEASRDQEGCTVCHTRTFCDACHRGAEGTPSSHDATWIAQHKYSARSGEDSCQVCHESGFCRACHVERAPADHDRRWLGKHGIVSEEDRSGCLLCHEDEYCGQCHGMEMPHPKLWLASHHKAAAENKEQCDRCHREEGCDTCHRGALPVSHQPSDWVDHHDEAAGQSIAECYLCHRRTLCDSCHGLPMPHPSDWTQTSHQETANRAEATCWRCHSQSDCDRCHGLAMPHPAEWVTGHGSEATATASVCTRCHDSDTHECTTCHASIAPRDHREETWAEEHGIAGATSMDLCSLCHGGNACVECHEQRAAAEG